MRRRRALLWILGLVAVALAAAVAAARYATASDRDDAAAHPPSRSTAPPSKTQRRARPARLTLTARRSGSLPAPVQDPAVAAVGNRVLAAGGLTAADASSHGLVAVVGRGGRQISRLPGQQHDAPAVSLRRAVYVFGGGNGVGQLDHILQVDPQTGVVRDAGRLPAASSDAAAAAVGQTAYIVGGFTGTRWLNTIVAWRPGERPSVVGHLRVPLRYAAVTAGGGQLGGGGGAAPAGPASRSVWTFDPGTRRVRLIGTLPKPTTHAAAATLDGVG